MLLDDKQELQVRKAFMTAFAKKLYREGSIDVSTLNRLTMKIDKIKNDHDKKGKGAA